MNVIHVDFQNKRRLSYFDAYVLGDKCDSNPTEAEHFYRLSIQLNPNFAPAWVNLGVLYFSKGEIRKARILFERAYKLDDQLVDAAYNIGYVFLETHEYVLAIHYFKIALNLSAQYVMNQQLADIHYNIAVAYYMNGDCDLSIHHFTEYTKIIPEGYFSDMARKFINEMM